MKTNLTFIVTFIVLIAFSKNSFAQPYTLDDKLKIETLELLDDVNKEGAKIIFKNATVENEDQFYTIKGHNMFQFVDVYVMANHGDPQLKADLAYTTWKNPDESKITTQEKDGIINFKLRAYDAFGLRVYASGEPINYTIAVYASEPIKEYLGSPFRKATAADLKPEEAKIVSGETNDNTSDNEESSNSLLYILLGVALLIIGFLAAKLLGNKKNTAIIIFFLIPGIFVVNAQTNEERANEEVMEERANEEKREREEKGAFNYYLDKDIRSRGNPDPKGIARLNKLGGQVGKALDMYKKTSDLYEKYIGLGNCMSFGPPPGMPKLPSFCESEDCNDCFSDARQKLNLNRYYFEQMHIIYKCTKNYSNSAIAFGNSVSGVHGVSGIVWQNELRGIEKSLKNLGNTYDKKYLSLLKGQKNILLELDACEAEHGIKDWYDRFGYLFYEFTKMNYRRSD